MSGRNGHYCSLLLSGGRALVDYRDKIYAEMGEPESYSLSRPHVTLHPGFTCDDDALAEVARVAVSAIGDEVAIGGVEFWPSKTEPHVVMLGAEALLRHHRDRVEEAVLSSGGVVDAEPVEAHITLFKHNGGGRAIERETAEAYEGAVGHGVRYATVNGYELRRRL